MLDLSIKPHIIYFNDSTYSYVEVVDIEGRTDLIYYDSVGVNRKRVHIDSIVFMADNPRYGAGFVQKKKAREITEEYDDAKEGYFEKQRRRR